jgi:hypothetical protein
LIANYSCPEIIISDNANNFCGEVLQSFRSLFNIGHIRTVAYTPQLNSYVERFHGWLMATLTTATNNLKSDWNKWLPVALYVYRTTTHSVTGYSPMHVVTGREPRNQFDLVFPTPRPQLGVADYMTELEENLRAIHEDVFQRQRRAQRYNLARRKGTHVKREYEVGDFVLVYSPARAEKLPKHLMRVRKMLDRFLGPFHITEVKGEGPRRRYTIFNHESGKPEIYRGESLSLYTPWTEDGQPSVPRREYISKEARRTMNAQEEKYRPRELREGDLVVFPRMLPSGKGPGFGVAKVLRRDGSDSWECQWYSNGSHRVEEKLMGPYLPCWDGPEGWYAAKAPRHPTHEPLVTSDSYAWNINRDVVAECGFKLTPDNKLPEGVYKRMEDHRLFKWRRSQ